MITRGCVDRTCSARGLCPEALVEALLMLLSASQHQRREYCLLRPICVSQEDVVNIKVNKLSSSKTQLPYEFYSLPYCRPEPIVNSAENLGEVLRGDRIENSVYTVRSHSPLHSCLEESRAAPQRESPVPFRVTSSPAAFDAGGGDVQNDVHAQAHKG